MDDPRNYRLTIDDSDPSWAEWNADRLPDVHGVPAGERALLAGQGRPPYQRL